MPWVPLSAYRERLPLTDRDGDTGYRISLHWWCWLKAWVGSVVAVAGLFAVSCLALTHWDRGWVLWTGLALAWLGGVKLVGLGLWHLQQTYIVVTRHAIYQRRVEDLVRVLNEATPMEKYVSTRYASEGVGILGLRTVTIETEGNLPNIELKHAAGGPEIERAIAQLRP